MTENTLKMDILVYSLILRILFMHMFRELPAAKFREDALLFNRLGSSPETLSLRFFLSCESEIKF